MSDGRAIGLVAVCFGTTVSVHTATASQQAHVFRDGVCRAVGVRMLDGGKTITLA
jgi:hypothetical protein